MPTADNLDWLVVGMGAALGAHFADAHVNRIWSGSGSRTFMPGAIVGGTPL